MGKKIDTLILTYNEQLHIKRAIENAKKISNNIFVLDSFSTDNTVKIAKECGAVVLQHKWEHNYAKQMNWGLDNFNFTSPWVLRLDADEYLTDELIAEINNKINHIPSHISGIILKRRCIFMGAWVKHGIYPIKLLRIFRRGQGVCESRWMDEHIVLSSGICTEFEYDFIDENLNNISWWINKHNNYAIREAIDYFDIKYKIYGAEKEGDSLTATGNEKGKQANKKRNLKYTYYNLPIFFRAFLYYIYRYIIKLGFLEGKAGCMYHFLQGCWYRFLVDCQIYEITKKCGSNKRQIAAYLKEYYDITL